MDSQIKKTRSHYVKIYDTFADKKMVKNNY